MIRRKHWKDGWLTAWWGRQYRGERKDLHYGFPCSPDGHFLHNSFNHVKGLDGKPFIQELEERGYDITTLQFSIRRKKVDDSSHE